VSRDALRERLRAAAVQLADTLADFLTSAGNGAAAPAAVETYTVTTLAAALHRSPSTIRMWCERGELEASRVKGRWYIRRAAVDRLLDGPRAEEAPSRTIRPGANNRAGPRRARAAGEAPDLSEWRRVRKAEP
jgi:excisionase family DNA binding protein